MAVTQADIDALNTAIANGERMVKHGDKWIEYRSVTELIAARNDLQRQLDGLNVGSGATPRPKQTLLYQSSRGN